MSTPSTEKYDCLVLSNLEIFFGKFCRNLGQGALLCARAGVFELANEFDSAFCKL